MLKGILFSLTASVLFGCLYYLAIHLRPLAGESVFGLRMVLTLPCLFLALFIFRKHHEFILFIKRVKQEPKLLLVILTTATIVGGQMWLFLWAPNSGKAIEVSMGYLLMPIVMVAFGKIIYKEPLSRNKWLAIVFAFIGVVSNIILAGKLSLESVFICTGYPIYFYLRRRFDISHLHSFVFEIAFLIPIAIYFISQINMPEVKLINPHIYIFIALLGIVSGAALICYTIASTILPFNLLGLLGYIEPCVMLLISFLIGETLSPDAYILMICLLIAILLLVLDGIQAVRRNHRKQKMKVA